MDSRVVRDVHFRILKWTSRTTHVHFRILKWTAGFPIVRFRILKWTPCFPTMMFNVIDWSVVDRVASPRLPSPHNPYHTIHVPPRPLPHISQFRHSPHTPSHHITSRPFTHLPSHHPPPAPSSSAPHYILSPCPPLMMWGERDRSPHRISSIPIHHITSLSCHPIVVPPLPSTTAAHLLPLHSSSPRSCHLITAIPPPPPSPLTSYPRLAPLP